MTTGSNPFRLLLISKFKYVRIDKSKDLSKTESKKNKKLFH